MHDMWAGSNQKQGREKDPKILARVQASFMLELMNLHLKKTPFGDNSRTGFGDEDDKYVA